MKSLVILSRVLFAAVALSAASLSPALADALDQAWRRVMASPDDRAANFHYARVAEQHGQLRHAYAALERIVRANPNDHEAMREYQRLKALVTPSVTTVVAEVGVSHSSNPRQLPRNSPNARRRDDGLVDAAISVIDERTLAAHRWRTIAFAGTQLEFDIHELNAVRLAGWTGPIFHLTPSLWVHIAPGGSVEWLDGKELYRDASLKVTFETVLGGTPQQIEISGGYLNVNQAAFRMPPTSVFPQGLDTTSDGWYLQAIGRFSFAAGLVRNDRLFFMPSVRYSQSQAGIGPTNSGFTFADPGSVYYRRPLFATDYIEGGSRLAYYFPIHERVHAGFGIGYWYRMYEQNVLTGFDPVGPLRRDHLVEPTAHLIMPDALGQGWDMRVDWRLEYNSSNDNAHDFTNSVTGVRLMKRF